MEALVRRQRIPSSGCATADPRRRSAPALAIGLLGLCLAFGASLLLAVATATPALALGPLPACRYDDVLTSPRRYSDWSKTLVDTILEVPRTYVPPDLVAVSQAGIAGSGKVRAVMIDDLTELTAAAAAAGNPIGIQSAYRSYDTQKAVFDGWVKQFGYSRALQLSARPGHSEHQLGLGIDFRSGDGASPFSGDWGTSAQG
jgi:hypothetical protein